MLHRQTTVQPLVSGGQGGGAPPVNAPPAQANVPAAQPQPGVSKTVFVPETTVTGPLICREECNLLCRQKLQCEWIVSVSPAWNARQRSPPNDAASKYGSCPRIDACARTGPGTSTSRTTRWPSNLSAKLALASFPFIAIDRSGSSMNHCICCDCLHFTCEIYMI